jgi:hypothetical protein
MLTRIELLELFRRLARWAPGSVGCKPVDLANALRMSVSEMTPLSLPDIRAPTMAAAGIAGDGGPPGGGAPVKLWGPASGVAGALGEGDADSTTHMRCDRVATSLATVCASVE